MVSFLDSKRRNQMFLDAGVEYGPSLERPENFDKTALEEGEEELEQVRRRVKDNAAKAYTNDITSKVDAQFDPTVVAADMKDGEEKLLGVYKADDVYIEDAVIGANPGYTATEHRYYRNLQIAAEEFEKAAAEQEDRSWYGYVADFVDREIFRHAVFGMWEDVTNRTARQGQEFADVLLGESDPQVVRAFMKQKVDDARSEGILTSDNYFAYNQLVREAYSLGYNPDVRTDRLLAGFDILLGAGTAAKVAGKGARAFSRAASLRSTTAATRAGAFGGVEAADKASLNIHVKEIDPINTANRQGAAVDLNPGVVRPSLATSLKHELKTEIAEAVAPHIRRGAVPDEALDVDWDIAKQKAIKSFESNTAASVYSTRLFDIETELGNIRKGIAFQIGKSDGTTFRALKNGNPESGAQKFADRIGGEVKPVNPDDLSQGYVVEVSEALDPRSVDLPEFDIRLQKNAWQRVASLLDNSFLGSTASRGNSFLNSQALRSENASRYLNNVGAENIKKLEALGFEDAKLLDSILNKFTNETKPGDRAAWDRNAFSAEWMAATGQLPSDKVFEAFDTAAGLSDMAWLMAASDAVKDAVSKGFRSSVEVADGVWIPVRRKLINEVGDNDAILDLRGDIKKSLTKAQVANISKEAVVFELAEKWNDVDYVVFPTKTPRVIDHTDVMGYSAYGRRSNDHLSHFTFMMGKDGKVKTLLGSVSKKDGDIAQRQLQAIQDAYKTADTEAEIDDVIARNNDWNPEINNKAQMDKWLADNEIDFMMGPISTRFRDAPYENTFDRLHAGDNVGTVMMRKLSRANKPLTQFGGGGAYNPDPIESIVRNYGSVAHKYAWNAYVYKASTSWLQQADAMMKNNMSVVFEIPKVHNPRIQFMEAKVIGNSPEAARMKELQAIIKRQMMMKTPFEKEVDSFLARMAEDFYDMTRKTDERGKLVPGSGIKLQPGDPASAVQQIGFFSAFAFNISQMFLQGSAVINTVAIAGRTGLEGLVNQTFVRIAMTRTKTAAEEALMVERLAKNLNISVKQADEILGLYKETLPNVVTSDIMELGTPSSVGMRTSRHKATFLASKFGRKLLDVGYIPFNQGEALAKSTAYMTAAIEFTRKNPNISILSEAGRNYVAKRTSTLSTNMTMSQRAAAQTGFWRVPSQWLNYFFRSFEQVFIGRDLTGWERARLGLAIMPLYGFTGLGMGQVADEVAEFFGLDPEKEEDQAKFIALKYGLLDGFLNYFTPFDVALSTRMAPATAVWDILDKFTEDGVLGALGGPSGSIISNGYEAMHNLVSNVYNGYTGTLTEDTMRILRNFSGVNNVAQAVGIIQDDVYRSRKGLKLPVEVSVADALISGAGFTPIEVTEMYVQIGENIDLSKNFKKLEKRMRESSQLAWSVYAQDPDKATQILDEARTIVSKAPLSTEKKRELLRLLMPTVASYRDVSKALYDNDRAYAAQWFESILGKGE